MSDRQLNEREKAILKDVVHNYIQTASPIGSRLLSKKGDSQLSSASIRIVMADLEELGLLSHPHTSAGRIPTDQGYRYYVDYLMNVERMRETEKEIIRQTLDKTADSEELVREVARLLSRISRQLSIVSSPQLSSGVFEKLELVAISSTRVLVIISVRGGLVRTIMLEVGMECRREDLERVSQLLNERCSGLMLSQIRDTLAERVRDNAEEGHGLVRLFIDSVDKLFDDVREKDKFVVSGTKNIIEQPEFGDPRHFRSVIELIENEEALVHLLEVHEDKDPKVVVTIGSENPDGQAQEYSVMTASYTSQGVTGRVGIIGPKRMDYSRLIPVVDYIAQAVASILSQNK